jgi:hypothetical protein
MPTKPVGAIARGLDSQGGGDLELDGVEAEEGALGLRATKAGQGGLRVLHYVFVARKRRGARVVDHRIVLRICLARVSA